MSVYYLTLNNTDYEYPSTLHSAKRLGESISKRGIVKIEAFSGTKHGGGGSSLYTLTYDTKQKKWIKTKTPYTLESL